MPTEGQGQRRNDKMRRGKMLLWLRNRIIFFPVVLQNGLREYKCANVSLFGWLDSSRSGQSGGLEVFLQFTKKVKKAFGNTAS